MGVLEVLANEARLVHLAILVLRVCRAIVEGLEIEAETVQLDRLDLLVLREIMETLVTLAPQDSRGLVVQMVSHCQFQFTV